VTAIDNRPDYTLMELSIAKRCLQRCWPEEKIKALIHGRAHRNDSLAEQLQTTEVRGGGPCFSRSRPRNQLQRVRHALISIKPGGNI